MIAIADPAYARRVATYGPAADERSTSVRRAAAAWTRELEAEALRDLRARLRSGAAFRDLAIVEAVQRRQEAERLRRQVETIARQQGAPSRGPGRLERAASYCARAEARPVGAERNPTAWRAVLLVVRGFALTEEEALDLLGREYAPRCSPPLTRADLRGMVRRALRAAKPPWGCKLEDRR